ncbi:MAG: CinA family nicotinamide mononucleotide deamidase-related protein [Chloroflexi bacterium]|nr:CinA family nicotinamide mononucleotide deamidase-related protein [Chloroflexota bacterium]
MRAEIVSIGTELLLGEIDDTNATAISKALNAIGIDVLFRTTVGDNEERIATVIRHALSRADIVITTGGLGPTQDDVTREGIARATARPLEFHEELYEHIASLFKRYGVTMSENNRRQAHAPRGALTIPNPVGTAPVFILETEHGAVMVLPGVPREMKHLLHNHLIPWIQAHRDDQAVIISRVLRTAGVGESTLDDLLGDLMQGTNPTVGLSAHIGQTDIRITAKAPTHLAAEQMIEPVEQAVRDRTAHYIYGVGKELLEDVVRDLLNETGVRVSIVEAGSGGVISERLGQPSETITLSSPPTEETAAAYAGEAQARTGADLGAALLIDVLADGTQAIATAVVGEGIMLRRAFTWGTPREDAPLWTSTQTLAMLWRALQRFSPRSD